MKLHRTNLFLCSVFIFGIAASIISCNKTDSTKTGVSNDSTTKATVMSTVERGKYLVTAVAGCGDCHTPWKMGERGPEPDMSRMLSGSPEGMIMKQPKLDMPWMAAISATFTAFSTPVGIAYSKNLTPDTSGIGKWDETMFILALRNGKHLGNGRPIMPPMPWQNFKNMTDDDLKAIWAYLRSIPPIKNNVPEAVMAPPPPDAPVGDMKKK